MASWAGFSDEELRKVKSIANSSEQPTKTISVKEPSVPHKKESRNQVAPNVASNNVKTSVKAATCHTDAKRTIVAAKPTDASHKSSADNNVFMKQDMPAEVVDLDENEALSRGMLSLDKFQAQQKQIEEANKQKKALLAKTISERFQKAQKETGKLQHIQKELSKLDNLLTADVQVIRGKIEEISRDFMEAQKRFEKAEQEYVAAKIDLHNKQELKEQLTEHLYTIIHQNEVRKAKKLAELMKTLDMDADDTDVALLELPPFSSFHPADILLSPSTSKQHLMLKSDKKSANNSEIQISGDASNSLNDNQHNCPTSDKNKTVNTESESSVGQSKIDMVNRKVKVLHCVENTGVPSVSSPDTQKDKPVLVKNEEEVLETAGPSCEEKAQSFTSEQASEERSEQVGDKSNTTSANSLKQSENTDRVSSEDVGLPKVQPGAKSKWDFDGSLL